MPSLKLLVAEPASSSALSEDTTEIADEKRARRNPPPAAPYPAEGMGMGMGMGRGMYSAWQDGVADSRKRRVELRQQPAQVFLLRAAAVPIAPARRVRARKIEHARVSCGQTLCGWTLVACLVRYCYGYYA